PFSERLRSAKQACSLLVTRTRIATVGGGSPSRFAISCPMLPVPPSYGQSAQSLQTDRDAPPIAQLASQRQTFLKERRGGLMLALSGGHLAQMAQGTGDASLVPDLALDRQALLVQSTCGLEISCFPRHLTQLAERKSDPPSIPDFPKQRQAFLHQ